MPDGTAAVERVFREEYGRLIASLVRRFGTQNDRAYLGRKRGEVAEARNLSQAVVSATARS
jgi:hypothetical protein